MQGKRIADGKWPENPGEYAKFVNPDGVNWMVCPPVDGAEKNFGPCSIAKHAVVEHEDGTITVSPSILISDNGWHPTWHGFLEHGIWRTC